MPQLMNTINGTYQRCLIEEVGISKHLLRQLVNSGTIPSVQAGNVRLINWNCLMDFLEKGMVQEPVKRQIGQISEDLRRL